MKASMRAVSGALLFLVVGWSPALAEDTRLRGTLTIDFNGQVPNNTGSAVFTTIKIPERGRIAGVRIPRNSNGIPFRGQEFNVFLPDCLEEGDAVSGGSAIASLFRRTDDREVLASVLRANVMKGAYECLLDGGAEVDPDPFVGNPEASLIGELVIWWTQIQQANENDLYSFFQVPEDQELYRLRYYHAEFPFESFESPECMIESRHIRCNRGGSALGIFSSRLVVRMKAVEDDEVPQ